jgi:hypothetical protein
MKNVFFSLLITFTVQSLSAQVYTIKNQGTKYTAVEINATFSNADLCGYIFDNQPNILRFDDGTEIRIASKQERSTQGITTSSECIKDPNHLAGESELWYIKQGILVREITPFFSK